MGSAGETAGGAAAEPPAPVVAAPVPEAVVDPAPLSDEPGPPRPTPAVAASARLGVEGLSRLRARHAEVLARITEKISEPARQEELKSEAERLNPDTWVTDADVAAGLEGYETVFEALRGVIGHRRKRRRRRGPDEAAEGPNAGPADAAVEPDDSSEDA